MADDIFPNAVEWKPDLSEERMARVEAIAEGFSPARSRLQDIAEEFERACIARDAAGVVGASPAETIEMLSRELREAEERLVEYRAALAPFAKSGELMEPLMVEGFDQSIYAPAKGPEWSLCGNDLRRARDVMAADGKQNIIDWARMLKVSDRLEHLLPNAERDGHLNITRYARELISWTRLLFGHDVPHD
jgi:hypothetical protein